MSDNGGYIKGTMRRIGVKKGNVISTQENELFRDTYDEALERFRTLAGDWWEHSWAFESDKSWDDVNNRVNLSWTVGDTRTEVELWLEKA